MIKKLGVVVAAVAALAISAAVFVGCSSDESSESSSSEIGEDFTLVVGFDAAYPPYGYVGDDGEYTGFDLDLAKMVCDKEGWELQLEPIDWDSKDALLESDAINCIWNGFTMEGREDQYTFSDPYMLNEQVVVVKSDSDVSSLDDLAGKTVITQAGSAALEVLEDDLADLADTFASLQTISDYNNAFMQLEAGTVDAVACDLSIAAYQLAANPDAYNQLSESLSTEHYGVGFKLGAEDLASAVNNAMKELDEEGSIEKLCDDYADQGISYDNWVL